MFVANEVPSRRNAGVELRRTFGVKSPAEKASDFCRVRIEPLSQSLGRVFRRPFCLSHAASAVCSRSLGEQGVGGDGFAGEVEFEGVEYASRDVHLALVGDGTQFLNSYAKRRVRGRMRNRRLCHCRTRSEFVIKPNAVGIQHRRIGA